MIQVLQNGDTASPYSDRALLEVALVSALAATTGAEQVGLYKVQPAGTRLLLELVAQIGSGGVSFRDTDFQSPEVAIPVESREEMDACICGEQSVAVQREVDGHFVHCIPVAFDGKIAAIVELIRADLLQSAELDRADGFLGLYRNYLSLLEYSERDTLTGLLNRRTFDDQVGKILSTLGSEQDPSIPDRAERREGGSGSAPHWIAVIDVDRFKRVNSRYGHLYGDEVLIMLANLMRESFRHRDKLFRFGGEEFVTVLRPAAREDVTRVLERFRERVAGHAFPQVGQVTVSVGFAPIRPGDTIPRVLSNADQALRFAKDNGRNQLGDFDALVAGGQVATGSDAA